MNNKWQSVLTEEFHVQDPNTLNWVSEMAQTHELFEASLGVNGMATIPSATAGVSPLYATPLNTTGMGDPMVPQGQTPLTSADFRNQVPGSGDTPISTLPMALNVALYTIGLELVPVVPAKGPWQLLTYMDFVYAGGKLGRVNETSFDGKGEGKENKPIYVKVLGNWTRSDQLAEGVEYTFTSTADDHPALVGKFKGFGRADGGIIVEITKCTKPGAAQGDPEVNVSITDVFRAGTVAVTGDGLTTFNVTEAKADFVQAMFDFVDGFANFYNGDKRPMTRGENETGTGNELGLRMYNKMVQVGSYEVTAAVTRQQLQDLPLYGVNSVNLLMEAMQNELSQHLNARILERVFALGVTNAWNQKNFNGTDLNLYLGTNGAGVDLADFPGVPHLTDIMGNNLKAGWGTIPNSEVTTSAENLFTRQRRIASRILAARNLISITGRRGPATWVVVSAATASALQDVSGYVVNPMLNTMNQNATQNLYKAGTLAGMQVYVDPYMDWNDTRICVGRKGNGKEPGVVFMPYILADKVQITAEGTMAPKMLINSRFSIVDAGYYPELMYYTFSYYNEFGTI